MPYKVKTASMDVKPATMDVKTATMDDKTAAMDDKTASMNKIQADASVPICPSVIFLSAHRHLRF